MEFHYLGESKIDGNSVVFLRKPWIIFHFTIIPNSAFTFMSSLVCLLNSRCDCFEQDFYEMDFSCNGLITKAVGHL